MSKTSVRLTPDRISDKWNRHMKTAVPDIVAGIDAMAVDPGIRAVEAQDKMLRNVTESISNGTWAKRRLAVSKSDWQSITKAKVSARLSTGVDQALPKRKKFDAWLVGRLNAILPEIDSMSDMTLEDSKARVIKMMDHMAGEKYKSV